jgi:hypothetical protein
MSAEHENDQVKWQPEPNYHKEALVDGILIDEGLAYLLKYLWNAGVNTEYSCQGGEEVGDETNSVIAQAYITFLEKNSFDIAWLLITVLANKVGLQDQVKNVKYWYCSNEWCIQEESDLDPRVVVYILPNGPRKVLYMPAGDMALLNEEAVRHLA